MSEEQPIIIKKKKVSGHGGHHGGAWKVAYADFVTAMMAFFLVMWIMGLGENSKRAVASYFREPGAFSFTTGKALPIDMNVKNINATGEQSEAPYDNFSERGGVLGSDPVAFLDSANSLVIDKAIADSTQAAKRLEQFQNDFKEYVEEMQYKNPDLKELLSSLDVELSTEGLRIELIESSESVFFEVGSASLTKPAQEILLKLAKEIGKLPNFVEIEGHTDSRPYGSKRGYTNWELSTDRGNSARKLLENNGLWQGQLQSVVGFADRRLRVANNPFDLSNRRISILIRQMQATNFIGNSPAS